ncbi:MAG TPA: ATP-binding protein [Bryobacteraceae bacterium]|nr:ATP-binding protein [Bryobacteraceae bacterium]
MSLPTPTILNVDDYDPGRYARTKILRQAGFPVIEAVNGREALTLVADRRPPLVLLDVNLPDISGFEVCQQIKRNPTTANTTVLHISASNVQSKHMVQGLDAGADSYLVEPIDPAVLVATVKAFLRARAAEDALRRSNEDLERFAYMVAHELNEPLRTVTAHTQLLARQVAGQLNDEAADRLGYVVDGAMRMRSFIDEILKYSQATHVGYDVRIIDCESLLHRVIANLDALVRDCEAKITHDAMPVIVADAKIEHVLQNLISNAIKYRRQDVPVTVHVTVAEDEGNWLFSVRDNGLGIEAQYKDRIFQIFRRLHGRDIPGNGIGLSLTEKIIHAHGGKIWVESALGVGSTFYFTLPQITPSALGLS